jgi:hypothetical protein
LPPLSAVKSTRSTVETTLEFADVELNTQITGSVSPPSVPLSCSPPTPMAVSRKSTPSSPISVPCSAR